MKKLISTLLAIAMLFALVACGNTTSSPQSSSAQTSETQTPETQDIHIGIVTGSVSQSEDDRRGAEALDVYKRQGLCRTL